MLSKITVLIILEMLNKGETCKTFSLTYQRPSS